jgi:glycosyltransferase involved in cell wall biosynthesis
LDAVVSLAQEDATNFARISRRSEVIPNYVSLPDATAVDQREHILLAVGHIEHRKGLDRLLWALQLPLKTHLDWQLVFVGGGDAGTSDAGYILYLNALISLLGLTGRVEVFPATSHIDSWYRRASIMVMGSRLEGFPMVLLEAKSYGLPVIAYDCPTGPKEIVVHGADGFLVDSEEDFSRAANKLMRDRDLRRSMSEKAIEDVRQRFLREVICKRWHELINDLHQKQIPQDRTTRWLRKSCRFLARPEKSRIV